MKLEIYNKFTGETVNILEDKYFEHFDVLIGLDGTIAMLQYEVAVCCADERLYGVRCNNEVC